MLRGATMPTIAELRVKAQKVDLPNYGDMNKAELSKALKGYKKIEASPDLTTSGIVTPPYINMRRNELAKLVKNPSKMTKDQMISELTK